MFLSNKPGVPPGINLLQKPSEKLSRLSGNLANPVIFSRKPGEDKDSTGSVTEGCYNACRLAPKLLSPHSRHPLRSKTEISIISYSQKYFQSEIDRKIRIFMLVRKKTILLYSSLVRRMIKLAKFNIQPSNFSTRV